MGSAPRTRLGSVPSPMDDDTHLEPQGLCVNKKHLRLGKEMTAGSVLVTSLGRVTFETGGLGWQWGPIDSDCASQGTFSNIFWLSQLGEEVERWEVTSF